MVWHLILWLGWQDHPPQADNKVSEDRASMAKLARSSRAHRAMRPRCKAICDMSVTSGQRHQPRANSPLSDPLWAKHWGLSIKLWQCCFWQVKDVLFNSVCYTTPPGGQLFLHMDTEPNGKTCHHSSKKWGILGSFWMRLDMFSYTPYQSNCHTNFRLERFICYFCVSW